MEKSYNGWTASKLPALLGGLDNRVVPGTNGVRLIPGLRSGDVATVLFYVAAQLHDRVESGDMYSAGDEWGYSYRLNRNANNLSCHSSGTAFDWNATRHPNGKRGTFSKAQVAEIRRILSEVGGVVRWGGDFTGTPDEMHFEIVASPATVAMVADRLTRGGAAVSPMGSLPPVPTPAAPEGFLMALNDAQQAEVYNKTVAVSSTLEKLNDYLRFMGEGDLVLRNTYNAAAQTLAIVGDVRQAVTTQAAAFTDAQLEQIADAVADEQARRQAA